MTSSRFFLVDQPPNLPGVCFVCRSANDGPYVDTGISIPFEGSVYIGQNCLREMFSLIETNTGLTIKQLDSIKRRVNSHVNSELTRIFAVIGDVINDTRTRINVGVDQFIPDVHIFDTFELEESEGTNESEFGDPESVVEDDSVDSGEGTDGVSSDSSDGGLEPEPGDGDSGDFRL